MCYIMIHLEVCLISVIAVQGNELMEFMASLLPQVAKATMALVSVASLGAYILAPSVVKAVTPAPTLTPTGSPATPRAKTDAQTESV